MGDMFILANFIKAIAEILNIGLTLFMWIVIAQAILSWVNPDPFNPIVRFINQVTEPVLYQIRKRIPSAVGGIDFSPIIVLLGVVFLKIFLVESLLQLALSLS
jgi:YggT family protein